MPSAKGFGSKLNGQIGGDVDRAGKTSGSRFGKLFFSSSMKPLRAFGAAAVGLFAVDKVKDFFASSMDEARESQKVNALTAQVIKSTGGAAQVSATQVGNLATAISNKVGVDDEAIQSGENLLMTFTGISNAAGKGNDIFNQATHAMTDMAAAMAAASGGELNFRSSATMLGKALNDPAKGLTALTRVGVTFTAQQQDQVKALVASGKTMDAQKLILKELRREFGGAAAAQATASDKMKTAWGNLKEQIGGELIPVIDGVENAITKRVIPAIGNFAGTIDTKVAPAIGGAFKQAGRIAGKIADFFQTGSGHVPLVGAFDSLKQHAQDTLDLIGQIGGALSGIDLSHLDAGQIGTALGQAVLGGVAYLANSVGQITSAIESMLGSVDWVGLGISLGPKALGLAVGLVAGIVNGITDPTLWSQIWHNLPQILLAAVAIAFAPAKLAGPLERILTRIPFAGKFLAAIVRGLQGLGSKVTGMAGDLARSFAEGFGKINIPGARIVGRVMAGLRGIPGAVGNFFGTLGTRIGVWAINAFEKAGAGARTGSGRMLAFVAGLPRRVVSALGDLGSLLFASGKALISGFAHGIESAAGAAYDAAKGVVGKVRNLFPFSPAKEGPFSGKGYTTHSGNKLMKDFGVGIGKGGLAAALATRRALAKVARETQGAKLKKQLSFITEMIGDGLSGKKDQKKIGKVKDSLGKLTDAIKKQLDKQLQAAKDKVSKIADTISSLKDTIASVKSSVAQNFLPDFTTNALFGPDGKMIKGTAISSFLDQVKAKGSAVAATMAAYKKLLAEGLSGDWLAQELQSGNTNLLLDLAAGSKSDALSAQSAFQQVTAQANALGAAVANNTSTKAQLDTATKQLASAQRQEAAAQRREVALKSIDHKLDKLDKLKKLDTLDADITRGLNRLISAANNKRRS